MRQHLCRPSGRHSVLLLLLAFGGTFVAAAGQQTEPARSIVQVHSDGWRLVGDLLLPVSDHPVAAVLMLNQAAGDREVYAGLAQELARRGVASLRLDLRGHGESTNLGRFEPGRRDRDPMIWDAEADVIAARRFLREHSRVDGARIAVVGASYSGEEMAEAGRLIGHARAYVALSPGSFSDRSIEDIDASGVPWLFVASRHERFLQEITASVGQRSQTVETLLLPDTLHATDILQAHPSTAERIAVWLQGALRRP